MNTAALEAIMESLFIHETCAYTGSVFEYLLLRINSLTPCVYSVFYLLLLLSKHFHVKAFILLHLHVLHPSGVEKSINKSFREAGRKFCQAIDTSCPWEPCLVRGDNAKLLKSLALLLTAVWRGQSFIAFVQPLRYPLTKSCWMQYKGLDSRGTTNDSKKRQFLGWTNTCNTISIVTTATKVEHYLIFLTRELKISQITWFQEAKRLSPRHTRPTGNRERAKSLPGCPITLARWFYVPTLLFKQYNSNVWV